MFTQKFLIMAVLITLVAWGTANAVSSKSDSPASLAGSWSGVAGLFCIGQQGESSLPCTLQSCRSSSYELSASCATASGKASQTAIVHQTGANSFSGSFHNDEYNVSGAIHIAVHGNSQNVSGESASGSLVLNRR
jgi:hypothetical protein